MIYYCDVRFWSNKNYYWQKNNNDDKLNQKEVHSAVKISIKVPSKESLFTLLPYLQHLQEAILVIQVLFFLNGRIQKHQKCLPCSHLNNLLKISKHMRHDLSHNGQIVLKMFKKSFNGSCSDTMTLPTGNGLFYLEGKHLTHRKT